MNDSNVTFYKVSYVVKGGEHPGAIINVDERPQVGDEVSFDGHIFEVIEIMQLMPPIGDMGFLHATCRYLREMA